MLDDRDRDRLAEMERALQAQDQQRYTEVPLPTIGRLRGWPRRRWGLIVAAALLLAVLLWGLAQTVLSVLAAGLVVWMVRSCRGAWPRDLDGSP